MIGKHRAALTAMLLEACCLTLTCAFLSPPLAGQDTIDNTFEVPITDTSTGGSPLEAHGRAFLHEVVTGPKLEWSWGAKVEVKNISDNAVTLVIATLTELGRHPKSGHRGGLGDGPTYIITEDRFFSDTGIRPSDPVVLRNTEPGELAEGCCVNSIDKVRIPDAEFKVLFIQFADGSIFGDPSAATEVFARRKASMAALGQLSESRTTAEKRFGEELDQLCASLGPICPQIAQAFERNGERGAMAEVQRLTALANKRAQFVTP
jgi:hypothetical protein